MVYVWVYPQQNWLNIRPWPETDFPMNFRHFPQIPFLWFIVLETWTELNSCISSEYFLFFSIHTYIYIHIYIYRIIYFPFPIISHHFQSFPIISHRFFPSQLVKRCQIAAGLSAGLLVAVAWLDSSPEVGDFYGDENMGWTNKNSDLNRHDPW